jgi:hypothetical protein
MQAALQAAYAAAVLSTSARALSALARSIAQMHRSVLCSHSSGCTCAFMQVWPDTTVAQLCSILAAPPYSRLNGDFVAAAAVQVTAAAAAEAAVGNSSEATSSHVRQLQAADSIGAGVHIVQLEMSRKPKLMWESDAAAAGSKGNAKLPSVQFGDLRNKNRKGT